jgi:hypothetical protein
LSARIRRRPSSLPWGPGSLLFAVIGGLLYSGVAPSRTAAAPDDYLGLELRLDRLEERRRLFENRRHGEVPPRLELVVPAFQGLAYIPGRYDGRTLLVEHDPDLDLFFRVKYPTDYPFHRVAEEVRGAFTVYRERSFLDTPGLEVEISDVDARARSLAREARRKSWRELVRRNIESIEVEEGGPTSRIKLDIPLPLPGAIESLIGKGEATNLQVSGQERIEFSGETTKISPFIPTEGRSKQSLFPDLEMRQELDVRLQGTVGEKVHIQLDHKSQGVGEGLGGQDNNRVRVNYQGDDDEIIQLIELGDTDLSLQGGGLVSFSTVNKGLFGVKVRSQFGPMDLDFIASKEEGEKANASFTAQGGSATENTLRDVDFIKNRYFSLDHPFSTPVLFADQTRLKVFRSVNPQAVNPETGLPYANSANVGYAYVDVSNTGADVKLEPPDSTDVLAVPDPFYFVELDPDQDYDLLLDAEDNTRVYGVIMRQPVRENEMLAVTYTTAPDPSGNVYTIGNYKDVYESTDTLYLELIKDEKDFPDKARSGYTWDYMLKNFYDLGERNISATGFELQIEELSNDESPFQPDSIAVPYIRFFGLDRLDETGQPGFDDLVDVDNPVLLDLRNGILQMPTLRPFDPTSQSIISFTNGQFRSLPDSAEGYGPNPDLYDKSHYTLDYRQNSKFRIRYQSTSTSRTIKLRNINIIEGTEAVIVDGRRLSRGTDYTIDYEFGSVELQGEVLNQLTPDSRITIDYQFQPLVGGGQSSLVGLSSRLNLGRKAKLGTIWLYEATSGGRQKPRLGEEPSRALIGDVNGELRFEPDFMTSMANWLPLVNTEAKSSLNLSGEIAMSIPDPNRKNDAVVDDMEGVDDSDIISLSRPLWYPASPPVDSSHAAFNPATGTLRYLDQNTGQIYRASKENENFYWLNLTQEERVTPKHLNPTLRREENRGSVQSLLFVLDDRNVDSLSWGGVMTGLQGGLDITNGQFLEIWVNDRVLQQSMRKGRVRIDLGHLDEDFHRPNLNVEDSEDKFPIGFNATTEDIGLDGVEGSGDRFDTQTTDERDIPIGINGTERNGQLDQEDLDRDGVWRQENSYFSFELNLADSAAIDVRRDFLDDPNADLDYIGDDAWRLYRFDLRNAKPIDPSGNQPLLNDITHLRIWFPDLEEMLNTAGEVVDRVEIAKIRIVGNRWFKDGVRDQSQDPVPSPMEDFAIGTIDNKEGGADYVSPFSVNEEENIRDKEQSLLLAYEDLEPGHLLRIRKDFATPRDFSLYNEFTVFVHTDVASEGADFFFWIAFDSTNYYEIYHPLEEGIETTANRWRQINVRLNDLTGVKQNAPDAWGVRRGRVTDQVAPDVSYDVSVVGEPDLRRVKWFYAGIYNKTSQTISEGQIWINDIQLEDVKREMDFARRLSGNLNFANVLNVSGSWANRGPDFHGLRASTGSGNETENLNLSGKMNIKDVIPLLGFNAPISAGYSNSKTLPKYEPRSDNIIEGDKILQDSLRTETTVRRFSVALNKGGSKNKLLRWTVDKINTSFNWSKSTAYRPNGRDTTVTMGGSVSYDINWTGKYDFKLWKMPRLRWWLNSFNFRTQAHRTVSRGLKAASPGVLVPKKSIYAASLQNSGSVTYNPTNDLRTNFTMQQSRNLALDNPQFMGFDVGREVARSHTFRLQYSGRNLWFFKQFSPDMDYQVRYNEDSSPAIARGNDPVGTRNVSTNRTGSLSLTFDVGGTVNRIGSLLGIERTSKARRRMNPRAAYKDLEQKREEAMRRFQEERDRTSEGEGEEGAKPKRIPGFDPTQGPGDKETLRKMAGRGQETGAGEEAKRASARGDTLETGGTPEEETPAGAVGEPPAAGEEGPPAGGEEEEEGGADWLFLFRKLYTTVTNIQPIKVTVREARTTSYNRLWERPQWIYRLGITQDAGIFSDGVRKDTPNSNRRDLSFQADTGLPLTNTIDLRTRFRSTYTVNEGLSTTTSKRLRTEFPDLSLDWSGLERWGIWSGLFQTASLNASYRRSLAKTGADLSAPLRENFDWSGSVTYTANWKNSLVTTASFVLGNRGTRRGGEESGNRSRSLSFDLRYVFSSESGIPIPIPFLFDQRIKLRSRLNFRMNSSYSQDSRYEKDLTQAGGEGFEVNLGRSSTLTLNPSFSYQFSRNLNGQFFTRYMRSSNENTGQTRTTVRVGLSATFNF